MDTSDEEFRVSCPSCQKRLKVAPKYAGLKIKCPACREPVQVPQEIRKVSDSSVQEEPAWGRGNNPAQPPDHLEQPLPDFSKLVRRKVSPEKRLGALVSEIKGDFSKPRSRLTYRFAAVLVVFVMLLLPVLYLLMIAAVGWLTYWHAMNNWYYITQLRGRVAIFAALLYGGLIVFGGLWVLSMIKPFFRNWGKPAGQTGLDRSDERLLYDFSDRIAELVGSPKPDVIMLSPDVNASASFHTGMLGLFRNQFVLTLGLPLIAGLTASQIAGVIAHEFGHFSQTGGTLIQRLIRRVNSWFAQAIYERDTVDELIDEMCETESIAAGVLGFSAWVAVNIGRGILWGLMWVGAAVSGTLSRQMEFDADQYECGLVGSEIFGETSQRMMELSIANLMASEFVMSSRNGNHLPKDLPSFVAGLSERFGKIRKKANRLIRDEKGSWLSTHPTTASRIAAAQKLNRPGIFKSKAPARDLLRDYRRSAEGWTQFLYLYRFGGEFEAETLRTTEAALDSYLSVMGGNAIQS